MIKKHNEKGSLHIGALLIVVVLAAVGFVGYQVFRSKSDPNDQGSKDAQSSQSSGSSGSADSFDEAFWKKDCSGSGKAAMSHMPMDISDVDFIVPLGMLAGPHVTPIDHVYFYPNDMKNKDTSKVYAMADGYIFYYETRTEKGDANHSLFFQHNCSTFSYYDLMTSLEPGLEKQLKDNKPPLHIKVTAGQVLGYVGGRSLDVSIFNFDKPLSGFVNPDSYKTSREWVAKQHADDMFTYFSGDNLSLMLAKNLRKTAPFGGKIDWDIDGSAQGNWFLQGSGGYASNAKGPQAVDNNGKGFWSGHLAIVPDNIDSSILNISFGSYLDGAAKQFSVMSPYKDPAKMTAGDQPTKYELVAYAQPSKFVPQPITARSVEGTVLLQLTDKRTLKIETFPNKKAGEVSGFTSAAKTYVR